MTGERRVVRCAIYTRKSSEEGLEQGFNSLEAQREACAAYIKSQAHEGWRLLPEHYDDGGHSGGTLERPAVQRLLEQVKARKLDIIVLYKIDRLTRSLTDFARLAELFDRHGVSFVSVTQQFNTSTSMGRLMLNVLLSFAQFEREITGERIRDKVAASKRKGIWMGGFVPLGYAVKDRALIVVPEEAETVRTIFRLYLKLGTVRALKRELDRRGYRTKQRQGVPGRWQGGRPFWPGHLYNLLGNPIYVGRIRHKDQVHPGTHKAIVDAATWDRVQQQLMRNRQGERRRGRPPATPSLLTGLLVDAQGNRFTPSHAVKKGRRYRYYVQRVSDPNDRGRPRRIPAEEIESVVLGAVSRLLVQPRALVAAIGGEIHARQIALALRASKRLRAALSAGDARASVRPLLSRVVLAEQQVRIAIDRRQLRLVLGLADAEDTVDSSSHELVVPAEIATSGQRLKLIVAGEGAPKRAPDSALVQAIARAHRWFARLQAGDVQSVTEIARREGLTETYVSRVLRLAFLAPATVAAILHGRAPLRSSTADLLLRQDIHPRWAKQTSL